MATSVDWFLTTSSASFLALALRPFFFSSFAMAIAP
ncbi:hypothetical protein SANTM175S_09806 [Streptomyces antimycoticus]